MNKKINLMFFGWFAFVPPVMMVLDTIMCVISPNNLKWINRDIDISIVCQTFYFSVWCSVITSIWALLNFIHAVNGKMPKFITSKNLFTFVFTLNMVVLVTFIVPFLMDPAHTDGFSKWYGMTKSIVEHFISPIIIIVYYFLSRFEHVSSKDYAKKYMWYIMIVPIIYLAYILVRWKLKYEYYTKPNISPFNKNDLVPDFPYPTQVDPGIDSIGKCIAYALILILVPVIIGVLFNFLSNLSSKRNIRLYEVRSKFYVFIYEGRGKKNESVAKK